MAERMIILPATLALTIEKQAVGSSDFTFAEILDKMATARTQFRSQRRPNNERMAVFMLETFKLSKTLKPSRDDFNV